jgi:tight adherence protein B
MGPVMGRRLAAAGALLVAALFTAVPAAHAAEASIDILSVDPKGSEVTIVVAPGDTLAGRDLTGATWKVSEGGRPVEVRVERVSNANLEVIIGLDVSSSMAGAPIDAAKAAAEEFARGLPASAKVGLVAFGDKPLLVVPLTTDRAALAKGLGSISVGGETALYDAVRMVAGLFSPGNDARHELVVLSDGGDTVSKTSQEDAISALTGARAAAYIGSLVDSASASRYPSAAAKATAARVLDELARSTGGRVVSATDVAAIRSVFGNIGAALTNQYRLTYPSTASGQTALAVSVSAEGTTASVDRVIDLPKAATPTTLPSARVMPETNQSWMKLVGLGSAFSGMLALGLFAFVQPRKRRMVTGLLSPLVSAKELASAKSHETSIQDLTNRASAMAERSLQRRGWASRLDISLERGGVPLRPGEFILVVIGSVFGAFLVGVAFFGPLFGIGFAVGAAFLSRTVLRFKVSRRRSKFESQLGDTLQLLSGSLRAGYGLVQALDAVAKNSEAPSADEFNRLIMEMRVGRDLPEALNAVATRIGSADFDWVVEAITINREIGGDLTELLDRAAKTIRERDAVRRQIKSLSAEGRLSAYVLVAIPIFLLLYMRVANAEYASELTGSPIGLVLLGIAGAGIGLGGLWLRKIVKVAF